MAGTVKKLQFSEGTDVGAPTDLGIATSTTVIEPYADDTAYLTANGTATQGDVYLNTTTKKFRCYIAGSWRNAVMEADPTDATKLFLVDVAGNTTGTSATLDFNVTTSRTYTFPDATDDVVLRTTSQVLTNKELTSPQLQTPVIKGATKSIDVDAAANLTIGASVGANTITIGGSSSTVVVAGDFTVQGTNTILNTSTLEVEDTNILVNNGGNDASSEGSGITVERTGTNGSLIYAAAAASKWKAGPAGSEVEVVTTTHTQGVSNKTVTTSDIDGGTASNTSRITVPKAATATLNALTRKEATLLYDTTTGQVKFDNGTTLSALATSAVATPTSQGTTTSYFPTIQSSVNSLTNAGYTVTTTDGYAVILVSTGTSDRTITLPAAASNAGRTLIIKKTDSASGFVLIDGNSSETIDGELVQYIMAQHDKWVIHCDGTGWFSSASAPEYAWSDNTGDNNVTVAAWGPGGGQFSNFTAQRQKEITWKTAKAKNQTIIIQTSADTAVTWSDVGSGGGIVYPLQQQSADNYGMIINPVTSTTDNIVFGKYRKPGAAYGTGTDWSGISTNSQFLYRIKKFRP